ncbi:MAG TPA: M20/M25/M40 family metallo-hydrolase [Candidatus Limnocylindria bacterium]|nr:M20/M25/M40 family metallo-hydrolase [Candidatus Limnocylindria bacterium]
MRPPRRGLVPLCAWLVLGLAGCGTILPSGAATSSAEPSTDAESGPAAASASAYTLSSIDLGGDIAAPAIRRHLEALNAIAAEHGGIRTSGTPGYDASVDYVVGELRAIGYEVSTPEFEMDTFAELPGGTLTVSQGGPAFAAGDHTHAMIYSADGEVTAPVATVGFPDSAGGEGDQGCSEADWDEFPDGAIALTPPGPCLRRDTVLHAQEAGAAGLVVANEDWEPGEARRPTLLFPDQIEIPVLSVVDEVGDALAEAAEDGAEVRISVDTEIGTATVRNVVAEHGSEGPVVMVGGHLDSVLDGPGINDNGSGVAAALEVAHLLVDAGHPGTVRVGFWAAEEFGLHGSRDYVTGLVPEDIDEIAAYINLDMLGSVNGVPIVYSNAGAASGSSDITAFLAAYLEAQGIGAHPQDLGTGSDHFFFQEAGVPTGGIFSGASEEKTTDQAAAFGGEAGEPLDPCYHLACDTLDNVDAERVAAYAQGAAAAMWVIAAGELPPA